MIKETTGKYREVCVPYRQREYAPYDDCYGVYKYAKRVLDDYVELSQTPDYESDYDTRFKRTIKRHRWVYQNEVGELRPNIIIHHINHVKGDDRPENLQATTRKKHRSIHNQELYKLRSGLENGFKRKDK